MGFALQTRLAASFGVCREFEGSVVSPTDSLRLSHVVSQHAGGALSAAARSRRGKGERGKEFCPHFQTPSAVYSCRLGKWYDMNSELIVQIC